jgi:hypothetical protein
VSAMPPPYRTEALPRHDSLVCGLTDSRDRLLCPACAIEAERHSAVIAAATGQADAVQDAHLDRLTALRDLICGWPRDPRPIHDRTVPDPIRQSRRRRLICDIARALAEAIA